MGNNIRKVLEVCNVKKKYICDNLAISPQAFNNYLNYANAKKYNKKIAELLNIDEKYLVKEKLTNDDIIDILVCRNKIEINQVKTKVFDTDVVLSKNEFLKTMEDKIYDFYTLECSIQSIGIEIPQVELNDGGIVVNENTIIFEEKKTGERICIDISKTENIIKRNDFPEMFIIVISNLIIRLKINYY